MSDQQAHRSVVGRLSAQLAVTPIPAAGGQILGQLIDEAGFDGGVDEAPG